MKGRIALGGSVLLLLLTMFGTIASGVADEQDKRELAAKVDTLLDLVRERQRQYGALPATAVQATATQLAQRELANFARDSLLRLPRVPTAVNRRTTVEYFPKNLDGSRVSRAFSEASFNVRVSKPVNDLSTNAIWVGDSVSVNDAKVVALTLLRAGVQLQSIRRFRQGGGSKARLIQVGADPALTDRPVLTTKDILSLQQLSR